VTTCSTSSVSTPWTPGPCGKDAAFHAIRWLWSEWHRYDLEWRGRLSLSNKAHVVFEAFNIFDATASDIDYFYAWRLPGECGRGGRDPHASGSSAIRARR